MACCSPTWLAAVQNHGLACIVEVSLDRQGAEALDAFEARAVADAEVQQVLARVAGADFVLVVHTRDMPGYLALSQTAVHRRCECAQCEGVRSAQAGKI